jgi:acetyl-CoA C-acetyltransferase
MAVDPRTPVIIGVGQHLQREDDLAAAADPVALMAEAVRHATADAGLRAVPAAPSLRVVAMLSWQYGNAPAVLAERLGIAPTDLAGTPHGGNSPQSLVNHTAGEIQRGELDLAILAGGEAFRTRKRAKQQGFDLRWPTAGEASAPRIIGNDLPLNHPSEAARGIVMPVQIYPMFETAIRAAAERSVHEHQVRISELWARFSEVAAGNPYAWSQVRRTPEELRTVTPANRMIGLPYPKLMNSNSAVDMAAALIVCSAERAESLGVPRDRWVFVHSGSDCHEHPFVSNRWSFVETPAIAEGAATALQLADLGVDDLSVVDLYSCFPSAVQLGAQSLGLPLDQQLTRTGGLPFAGGPWNNYSMHAIATVVGELRDAPDEHGFVWANGGYATKHAFGVYGAQPPPAGFRWATPQAVIDRMPQRVLAEPADAAGPALIEAYTVMHNRQGAPETAAAACLLADGRRAWGTSDDPLVARQMCDGEWVGAAVRLDGEGRLHLDS